MSSVLDLLKSELTALTARERAEMAQFLLHSLESEDPDVEAAWDTELRRRADEIRSGAVEGRPAPEVFSRLREKYS